MNNYNTVILNELKEHDLTPGDVSEFYIEDINLYSENGEIKTYDFDIAIETEDLELMITILIDAIDLNAARETILNELNETL